MSSTIILWSAYNTVRKRLTQKIIHKLIKSIPNEVEAFLKAKVGHTDQLLIISKDRFHFSYYYKCGYVLKSSGNPLKVILVSYCNYLFFYHFSVNKFPTGPLLMHLTCICILVYKPVTNDVLELF